MNNHGSVTMLTAEQIAEKIAQLQAELATHCPLCNCERAATIERTLASLHWLGDA